MPVMPKAKQFVVCDPNFLPFFFFQNITKPKTTPSLPPPSPQADRTDLFTAAKHPHWPLLWLCPHPGYWEPPGRDCSPGEVVRRVKEPEEALSPLEQCKRLAVLGLSQIGSILDRARRWRKHCLIVDQVCPEVLSAHLHFTGLVPRPMGPTCPLASFLYLLPRPSKPMVPWSPQSRDVLCHCGLGQWANRCPTRCFLAAVVNVLAIPGELAGIDGLGTVEVQWSGPWPCRRKDRVPACSFS